MKVILFLDQGALVAHPPPGWTGGDDEPLTEPCTVKLSQTMTDEVLAFVREERFSKMGPAVRELIRVGLKYHAVEGYRMGARDRVRYESDSMVRALFFEREGNLDGQGKPPLRLVPAAGACPPGGAIYRTSSPERRFPNDDEETFYASLNWLKAEDYLATDWAIDPAGGGDGKATG